MLHRGFEKGVENRKVQKSTLASCIIFIIRSFRSMGDELPHDVWGYIFSLLPPADVIRCFDVCKDWDIALSSDSVCMQRVLGRWGDIAEHRAPVAGISLRARILARMQDWTETQVHVIVFWYVLFCGAFTLI
jgi:hypothetical protein